MKYYEEIGKGFINSANLIGGLSVINQIFGNKNLSLPEIVIIFYSFVLLYLTGANFIKKGTQND